MRDTNSLKKLRSLLLPALRSEAQAIGIYEAEVFFRRLGKKAGPHQRILDEEKAHQGALAGHLSERRVGLPRLGLWLDKLTGWSLGTAVSVLPDGLNYRVHEWAEKQAADIYRRTAEQVERTWDADWGSRLPLLQDLRNASLQESAHAQSFADLRKRK